MFKNMSVISVTGEQVEVIMLRPMAISGLTVDPLTNSPIVILKETDGERTLPIWIGLLEATAIASELEGIKFSRPMTHDLLKSIMDLIDVKVKRVEVCDLKNNTYYALIHITHGGEEISIDARPSDALALSLRVNAPIFVAEEVISKSKEIDLTAEAEDKSEQGKKWQEILEKLNPEDFGKYKM
jgi:bifunctional DNase/RNase